MSIGEWVETSGQTLLVISLGIAAVGSVMGGAWLFIWRVFLADPQPAPYEISLSCIEEWTETPVRQRARECAGNGRPDRAMGRGNRLRNRAKRR
jgi:hypothetical protein